MGIRRTLTTMAVGALALSLASCSGAGTVTSTVTAATSPSATPAATPTASAPPPPAATSAPPPPAHVWEFGDEWTTSPQADPQGSGCAPGANNLPDGVWFGFVKSWSTSQIAFDLACWWTGSGAAATAAARGDEVNNDYYITNDNTTIRLVTVDGDIPAKKAGWEDGVFTLSQVIADPGGSLPTNPPYPAWIYVNGGVVTELAVQYIP